MCRENEIIKFNLKYKIIYNYIYCFTHDICVTLVAYFHILYIYTPNQGIYKKYTSIYIGI